MRLGGRRPGNLTAFVDSNSQEPLLQVTSDARGLPRVAFRLFDASGRLVSDSGGFQSYPEGLRVEDESMELLLLVPTSAEEHIQYRLYNCEGRLLTCSDGSRTQIFGGLRVDGTTPSNKRGATHAIE